MPETINGTLTRLAAAYYISHGSPEQRKIDASVVALNGNIKTYFGSKITEIIEFGSYKRDTILPREYDSNSDVDIMIIFNHASLQVKPGTYRNYIVGFADKYYKRSDVRKTSPTVTLELDHIKYDLVPAHKQTSFFSVQSIIHIPKTDNAWMETDPHGFTNTLVRINNANGSLVKPLIRLLKAWNAKVGYPYSSYDLEREIAGMNFWGCTTLEQYFFRAIDNLNPYIGVNLFVQNAQVVRLKENARKVVANLNANNSIAANLWLAHILPMG